MKDPRCGISGQEAGNTKDDRKSQLRHGILLQAAKELGSYLIAGGEEEEIKKDIFDYGGHLDVQLPDGDSRKQRPYNRSKAEGSDLDAADEKTQRQR